MSCSTEAKDRICVKRYGFLSFANMSNNTGKNISKSLSSKYSQKLLQQWMHLKLLQREHLKNKRRNWWFYGK